MISIQFHHLIEEKGFKNFKFHFAVKSDYFLFKKYFNASNTRYEKYESQNRFLV